MFKSEKLQVFQNEIHEIQLLLKETQTENQITKARLIEYEEISCRNKEKLHEFEVKTQKIRKESHDILEINRKSLKGIEENTIFLEKNPNFSLEELHLDEELNKLDKVFRNSEVLTKEMQENSAVHLKSPEKNLLKDKTPSSKSQKSHKNLTENSLFRSKTFEDLNNYHWKKHNKMMSEVDLSYFSSFEHDNKEQILFRKPETLLTERFHSKNQKKELKNMVESEDFIEKRRKTYNKSKSMQIKDFFKKKEKLRAKSFDSEEKEGDLKEKNEILLLEIKEKIMGILGDLVEKTKENRFSKEKEEIQKNVKTLEEVFLKVFEIFERIMHQKILQNLELSTNFTKISNKLKRFLVEKSKFNSNLNEILNIFEGKSRNSLNFTENNAENLLLRLKKMIEGFISDEQQMKSLSFDFSDLIKEKNEIEKENTKIKKDNQSAITSKNLFSLENFIKLQ